ncbi:MAG: histidinol-phosphatase [Bacteroidia bacterium]|nr:histidinol-phosphatase [Bacteroidia bacterium]
MAWTNYHSHTHFCDGTNEPEDYIIQALEDGVAAYGFSTHAPIPFHCKWAMKKENAARYFARVRELKKKWADKIEIYASLEIDYVPGRMGPDHADIHGWELDYTLGSVHFVDDFPDGTPWEIDGTHDIFLKGLEKIFGGDARKAISRYYELTRWMVMLENPDIVGHLDKIKMQNKNNFMFHESDAWYREEVIKTLKSISNAGSIVEVNTRGLYKGVTLETYPSRWILETMFDMGIPVQINSDSHHPREIVAGFEHAARILKQIGYRQVRVLAQGKWQDLSFDENGIDFPRSKRGLIRQAKV